MSAANDYTGGSVFTVRPLLTPPERRHEVAAGQLQAALDDPLFHVAVVQFSDVGKAGPGQYAAAIDAIRAARRDSVNGALVVVFIHGWHHNADWTRTASVDAKVPDGDCHFHGFRLILESLALREAERAAARRVIGVYLSWNGDPDGPIGRAFAKRSALTWTSFPTRYRAAQRIGEAPDFQETLRGIVATTKNPLVSPAEPETPLVMIGHSMGALMLESGIRTLLQDTEQPLIRPVSGAATGAARVTSGQSPVLFPDLILALNSAADSRIASAILGAFKKHALTKTASSGDICFNPPIMISVTSTGDWATKLYWRLAQHVYALSRRTDGHDKALLTHDFVHGSANSPCPKWDAKDFGQNWHCLRKPTPPGAATPSISIDLPARSRAGLSDTDVPHTRYTITPRPHVRGPAPVWVFQVSPDVIKNHNDIFDYKASSLMLALIQISGAVASLAANWARSFEPDGGP